MRKTKTYARTKFTPKAFTEATLQLWKDYKDEDIKKSDFTFRVDKENEEWHYDSEEEFIADYIKATSLAYSRKRVKDRSIELWLFDNANSRVEVTAEQRSIIEGVFAVFESHLPESLQPVKAKLRPTIYIGHGHSPLWKELKDHLHEKHGYSVEAFEIGARAGYSVRDVLQQMLEDSSFALLVMTGENQMADGAVRARQNVIHEIGLFQGRLGFNRAIVLLEKGTEEFSNISGIVQIRFSNGNINETFGEVLATLRREFGESS